VVVKRQLGQSSELRVESPAVKKRVSCQREAAKRRLYMCCSYSKTDIITVFKSVARIRLVKIEKTYRVPVTCKVWRSVLVL
jgi:hypothetical protein